MNKKPPEACVDAAQAALAVGDPVLAMRWYNTARARTLGHRRRDRYEARADNIAAAHMIPRDYGYATEEEDT